jgi:drug/metabolite transporter (DMT)-like permease
MGTATALCSVSNSYLFQYICTAAAATLLVKMMMSTYDFDHPIAMSVLQVLVTFVFVCTFFVAGICVWTPLPYKHVPLVAGIAVLTSAQALSTNEGISRLSLALQQILKALAPVPVVLVERVLEGKSHSWACLLAISGLMLASCIGSVGTVAAGAWDTVGGLCMLSVISISALKYVMLHQHIHSLKKDMTMLAIFFWIEVFMLVILVPIAAATDQLLVRDWNWKYEQSWSIWILLLSVNLLQGTRAFIQQQVLAFDSALTLACCNGMIQTVVSFISVPVFHDEMNWQLWIGAGLSLVSSVAYGYVRAKKRFIAKREDPGDVGAPNQVPEQTNLLSTNPSYGSV